LPSTESPLLLLRSKIAPGNFIGEMGDPDSAMSRYKLRTGTIEVIAFVTFYYIS